LDNRQRVRVPHPIPYQGSKRGLAPAITACFPTSSLRLIEPFAGSAAVSLAAALAGRATSFTLNDANAPLMRLWQAIIEQPQRLADDYERLWQTQQGQERAFYAAVRDEFNRTQRPAELLYLLARCVKASVRYNAQGAFNQSPDHRRQGARPATMRRQLLAASALLAGRTQLSSADYRTALQAAQPDDLIYLDPPYQGVWGQHDPRYIHGLAGDEFVAALEQLNRRGIAYLVSYDGRTDSKTFGPPLPAHLQLRRIELHAGRSSQATLLGRAAQTYESLYLSPALLARLAADRSSDGRAGAADLLAAKGAWSGVRDRG
jgi:DNA adenine methylase